MVITRPATAGKCASVRPLVKAHAKYERRDIALTDDWEHRIARLIDGGRITLYVASVRDAPVGYASVTNDVATWTGELFAHLDCLFVAAGHRGSGLGQLLFDTAGHQASRDGINELQWQTPAWNARAIRFYERLGATHLTKERFILPLIPATPLTG